MYSYRGCPLAYEESKTGGYDMKEGLSYTSICATNILNYLPSNCPAVVLHSSNVRFRMQVMCLDKNNTSIQVLQRDGIPYTLQAPPPNDQCDTNKYGFPPILYRFCAVSKGMVPLPDFKLHFIYQNVQVEITAHEAQQARQQAEVDAGIRKVKRDPSPSLSYEEGKLHHHNSFEEEFLLINIDDYTLDEKACWENLHPTLKRYMLAIFEAIDVVVGIFVMQNEEKAAEQYNLALETKKFCLPCKYMRESVPCRMNVNAAEFIYSNVANWKTSDNKSHSNAWVRAKAGAIHKIKPYSCSKR